MKRELDRCKRPANPALVGIACAADATELAEVAAATFPLACPSTATAADIAAFIADNLSSRRFSEYLADSSRHLLVIRRSGRIIGYAMLIRDSGDHTDVTVELSKMYLLSSHHRTGDATALMTAALAWAADQGARSVWLGVNQRNRRAQRFYAKHGFEVTGTRTFGLGGSQEDDFVMVRPL